MRRDFRLDRQVRVGENVEVIHQLLDELEIFQPELRGQIFDDDRRLDVNDLATVFRLGYDLAALPLDGSAAAAPPASQDRRGRRRAVARMREIGGRNVRFTASSETARFGFGTCALDQRNAFHRRFRRRLRRGRRRFR